MNYQYIHKFIYFNKSAFGTFLNTLLNSISFWRFKTIIFKPFTYLKLRSDIEEVIYLNWLIPKERITSLIPKNVKVQEHDGFVVFTCLIYKHKNFAPLLFGPFRKFFGSPYQSNWRLYIDYPKKHKSNNEGTILFIKNILSSINYTIGSRLMSNILQSQCAKEINMINDHNSGRAEIISGEANLPSLSFKYTEKSAWEIGKNFGEVFKDSLDLIHAICYQEFAVTELPIHGYLCKGEINLQFNENDIKPIELTELIGDEFKEWIQGCDFVGFKIPHVRFTTLGETIIRPSN